MQKATAIGILGILIFSFNLISAQNSSTRLVSNQANWKTYKGLYYTIQYPETWTVDDSKLMGTTLILFSPLEDSKDQFKENVNLFNQDLGASGYTLDKYIELSLSQLKSIITAEVLLESIKVSGKNGDYQRLQYTGDQGIYHLQFEQYIWLKEGKVSILTLTVEQKKWDLYKDLGKAILDTFSF